VILDLQQWHRQARATTQEEYKVLSFGVKIQGRISNGVVEGIVLREQIFSSVKT
jgi:hypothetical protein